MTPLLTQAEATEAEILDFISYVKYLINQKNRTRAEEEFLAALDVSENERLLAPLLENFSSEEKDLYSLRLNEHFY